MNIQNAKYFNKVFPNNENEINNIQATIDDVLYHVPLDPANRHYVAILEWAKIDGNRGSWLMVKASEVKAQIDTHEAICSQRWLETLSRIKRLEMIIISTAAASILLLISLLVK